LGSICEKIIVPNIQLRECDIELFEDNPEEYIRIDLVTFSTIRLLAILQNRDSECANYYLKTR